MNLISTVIVSLVAVLGAPSSKVDFKGPGWYRLELEDGQQMTLKVMSEDGKLFTGLYQGVTVQMPKEKIRSLLNLKALWKKNRNKAGSLHPDKEEKIRDIMESISTNDKDWAIKAFRMLRKTFPDSRSIVHESLKHRTMRVRKLSVKLLGELGEASEDLKPVFPLLRDNERTVRLAAIFTVRHLANRDESAQKEARTVVLKYLRWEPIDNNRKMGVKSFERWRDPVAVKPLVEFMQEEKGRGVRLFIAHGLEYFTKQKFGDDPEAWKDYLEKQSVNNQIKKYTTQSSNRKGK